MNSQVNNPKVVEQEKRTVQRAANLSPDTTITFIDGGWDSRVYTYGDRHYFFKFPRSEKIQKRYVQEIAILKLLQSTDSGLQFPAVIWEGAEGAYFGYEGVHGEQLSSLINELDEATKTSIGTQIGHFLKKLHSLELSGARTIGIEQEVNQFQEWFAPAKQLLADTLSEAEYTLLEKLVFETWPSELTRLGANMKLCHGDLHLPNIMYNTSSQRLGIIDFGDVGYYDNSKDFVDLGDETLAQACLRSYSSDVLLEEKITLRKQTTDILTLTYYIGKNNAAGVEKKLQAIRTTLQAYL